MHTNIFFLPIHTCIEGPFFRTKSMNKIYSFSTDATKQTTVSWKKKLVSCICSPKWFPKGQFLLIGRFENAFTRSIQRTELYLVLSWKCLGRGLFASTRMLQEWHNFIAFRNKTYAWFSGLDQSLLFSFEYNLLPNLISNFNH